MLTYAEFLAFLKSWGVVDVSIVVANFATFIAFVLTLISVRASRRASERAETAAKIAVDEISRIDTFIDLSSVIAYLEAIKTLHRQQAWPILSDRYAGARKLLIGVRTSSKRLTEEQIQALTSSIINFKSLERQLDKYHQEPEKIDIRRANSTISDDIDNLIEILHSIRTTERPSDER